LRHAFARAFDRRLIGDDRKVIGLLHERDFCRRFKHATTRGHGSCAYKLQCRCGLANAIEQEKPHAFLDADSPGAQSAIAKDFGYPLVRTLILFPGTNVFAHCYQLARAFFFKLRAHPGDFAARRYHHGKHSLAGAPTHAGVIEHAGARLDVDGIDLVLAHQSPRLLNSGASLIQRDGHDVIHHPFKLTNGRRQFALLNWSWFGCFGKSCRAEESYSGDAG
jgi:hypothetical protein